MSIRLSKTDYKYYLDCPEEAWLRIHRRDLVPKFSEDQIFILNQGNEVDKFVEKLFVHKEFMRSHKLAQRRVVFQQKVEIAPKSVAEGQFLAVADVVVFDDAEGWCDIYEVKATKEPKDDHLFDIAFQRMVFELAGFRVRKTYLVHISPSYVFEGGETDPTDFFRLPNVSDRIEKIMDFTRQKAVEALDFIAQTELPTPRFKLCSNKLDCFYLQHFFPNLPEYTVLDIRQLSAKKRQELLDQNVFDIADVPTDFPLSVRQRQQVNIAQSGEIFIDKAEIRKITEGWQSPFYFLDYETVGLVFPRDKGVQPYQQCVFQYSLHKILGDSRQGLGDSWGLTGDRIAHFECVLTDKNQTMRDVLNQMQQDLANDGGTVFVWNMAFEKTRNSEMARLFPEFANFLNDVNSRMYDLEVPFRSGLYQHPQFKGKSSIKKVLPVLVPELSYATLNIQHGGQAYTQWHKMIFEEKLTDVEREQIRQDLLEYCKLDTWAMVKIWEKLLAI